MLPARLTQHPIIATLQLLLLGFGDVRHVLSTAAACAGRAGKPSKRRQLSFLLNDISPLNVDRGILLMHLVNGWRLFYSPPI